MLFRSKRKVAIDVGTSFAAAAEKEMLQSLQKIEAMQAKDRPRYGFALKTAIETTQDSADLSAEDLNSRATEITAQDAKEKKERESMIARPDKPKPAATEEAQADAVKAPEEKKRKAPSLYRPGEKPPDQQQQPPKQQP